MRPLSGRDEVFLSEEGRALLPARRVTALLERTLGPCVSGVAVTPEFVRRLTVGDREALMLHLRRLTLGGEISCIISCPLAACGEQMDLDLKVEDLLVPPNAHARGETHEAFVEAEGRRYRVLFRLPNGGDQEDAAALAASDWEAAMRLVMRRCVKSTTLADDAEAGEVSLPPDAVPALQSVMASLDEQAEIVLDLKCPACGHAFSLPFDIGDYFQRELTRRGADVYREVHQLALHYHWSEAEILAMTRARRRLYLGLLADTASNGRTR
ncbi:MAG TPA: hypothetical protein VF538_09925 [Pyrinomonadaceae bacterium]